LTWIRSRGAARREDARKPSRQPTEESVMRLSLLTLTLVLAAALPAPPALAQDHAAHHAAPAAAPAPASTQRWTADATLRRNMRGIRTAVDALGHYEHGHMGPEQAVAAATKIQGHANEIIAQCKLPPDADAALHAILVPLMSGAAALKQDPKKLDVIAPMREALAQYDRQFDHARGTVEDAPEQH
jgi:hypothetical protein